MNPQAAAIDSAAMQAVANRLRQNDKIVAAYLLGSAVDGRLRADSDVDIALLPARGASFTGKERMDLAGDLEILAGKPVDLGILNTGNLVYAKEAVARGKVILERDRAARVRFDGLVLSMYAELQENRREALHAYAA